jgi:hypothetical protein
MQMSPFINQLSQTGQLENFNSCLWKLNSINRDISFIYVGVEI